MQMYDEPCIVILYIGGHLMQTKQAIAYATVSK